VDVFQSNRVSADKKALWAVVLFLGNIFAMPVYWYLYLWRPLSVRKSDAQASPQSAS
jgi:type II secretory pathway component PulM